MSTSHQQSHPLFPPTKPDDEPAEVGSIRLYRLEQGRRVLVPRTFAPHELTSPEQIHETYGGGAYLLQARSVDGARITANVQLDLPGAPKPLAAEPQAPHAPAIAPSSDPTTMVMQMMFALMQSQTQAQQSQNQLMTTLMMENSKQLVAMVTGMLSTSRQDAQAMVQAIGQLSTSASKQQGELFQALLAARGSDGGSGQLEAFIAGMQAREEAGLAGGDDLTLKEILPMLPSVLGAINQGKADARAQMTPPAAPAAPMATPATSPIPAPKKAAP